MSASPLLHDDSRQWENYHVVVHAERRSLRDRNYETLGEVVPRRCVRLVVVRGRTRYRCQKWCGVVRRKYRGLAKPNGPSADRKERYLGERDLTLGNEHVGHVALSVGELTLVNVWT